MPRGVYERKPKSQQLADQLRAIADQIESEMGKVEQVTQFIKSWPSMTKDIA